VENKETLKVLSIDMDYILSPCINLYNDMISASKSPEQLWETVNQVRQIDEHIDFDKENLQFLFKAFTSALFNLSEKGIVIFATNHDAILLELASQKYENDIFEVYNIDHHHDIYYSKEARVEVEKYNISTVANWVWYLDKYGKIKQYNWICNKNSVFPEKDLKSHAKMDAFLKEGIGRIFDEKDWDVIFVCNSPHWFPRTYDVYFNMLIDIYKNYSGKDVEVIEEIFCPNGKSRPYPYDKKA
jgi:hypothetical protein